MNEVLQSIMKLPKRVRLKYKDRLLEFSKRIIETSFLKGDCYMEEQELKKLVETLITQMNNMKNSIVHDPFASDHALPVNTLVDTMTADLMNEYKVELGVDSGLFLTNKKWLDIPEKDVSSSYFDKSKKRKLDTQ